MRNDSKILYKSKGIYSIKNKWLIVICDPEITSYYRSLIKLNKPTIKLQPCYHTSHITVIAGKYEKDLDYSIIKEYDGKEVEFLYDPIVKNGEEYYWLTVFCHEFSELRIKMGLSPTTPYPWHLTIGNLKF